MSTDTVERVRQVDPAEHAYATQLAFLAAYDDGPRPPAWKLTPKAVVMFIVGSGGELTLPKGARRDGLPAKTLFEIPGDRGAPIFVEEDYSDYREVAGIKLPFAVTV